MTDEAKTDEAGIPREPTGEIKDQAPTKSETEAKSSEGSVLDEPEGEEGEDDSILGKEPEKEEAKPGAPEKYEAFTLPEGYEADEAMMGKATTLFKELGLPQEAAQKLVDFYAESAQQAVDAPINHWLETQKEWKAEIAKDPQVGHRLREVRTNFSKMLDTMDDPSLVKSFREALIFTGAGNHPAFVKLMDKLSQRFTEGSHVRGNGPTKESQAAPGSSARPSVAAAIYPNLPAS